MFVCVCASEFNWISGSILLIGVRWLDDCAAMEWLARRVVGIVLRQLIRVIVEIGHGSGRQDDSVVRVRGDQIAVAGTFSAAKNVSNSVLRMRSELMK